MIASVKQATPEDLDFDFAQRCFDFPATTVYSIVSTSMDRANGGPKDDTPWGIYAEQLLEAAQFRAATTDPALTVEDCAALQQEGARIARQNPRYAGVISEAINEAMARAREILMRNAPVPETVALDPLDADLASLAKARADAPARSRRI